MNNFSRYAEIRSFLLFTISFLRKIKVAESRVTLNVTKSKKQVLSHAHMI